MIPKAITGVVNYDPGLLHTAAYVLVSLARHDSFNMAMQKKDLSWTDRIADLFTRDQSGKDLLSIHGPGHMGAGIGFAVLAAYETIPHEKLPLTDDGHTVHPTHMAIASLMTAVAFLENLGRQAPEGPTRKDIDGSAQSPVG